MSSTGGEDKIVGGETGEPSKRGPAGVERWIAYLDWVRQDLADSVLALPEHEQRTTRLPSGWSPIEMLSHGLHLEQRWFVWGFLAEPVDEPWGDWNVDEPWRSDDSDDVRPRARWTVPDDVTAEELAARLAAIGERTREILRTHPFDAPGRIGGRFGADPPTLEWICFHVLAEYHRHLGHLDIAVELANEESDRT